MRPNGVKVKAFDDGCSLRSPEIAAPGLVGARALFGPVQLPRAWNSRL